MQSIVNKVKLIKMYSNPEIFHTVNFKEGLNIILGEKCEDTKSSSGKTNGVGKSICVEFINFGLLKDYDKSRVSNIPPNVLNDEVEIILELEIDNEKIIIKRNIKKPNSPQIIYKGENQEFKTLKDANNFMEDLIYKNDLAIKTPSYREMMAPLMREETSGFNNIVNYFDANKKVPDNPNPLLYMLNINLDKLQSIKKIIDNIDNCKKKINSIKKVVTNNNTIKLEEVRAELNAMNDQVVEMQVAIENAKSNEAFETIEKDILQLENIMDELRIKQKAIRYEMKKIKSLPDSEKINTNDVKSIYNFFKDGLGDVVTKSLEEVIQFKDKIENYQNKLMNEKYFELEKQNKDVTDLLRKYDDEYSRKIKIIDKNGTLKNLKNSISIYAEKSKEFADKNEKIKLLDEEDATLKRLKSEKSAEVIELDIDIQKNIDIINEFRETLYSIHQEIMGNKKCYFEITANDKPKNILDIILRIDADGSLSVDRTKVFLYDISLLLNDKTNTRHPGFLIHDNIFLVDKDTLLKSLNFLNKQEILRSDFQYIMTLNRDAVENEEKILNFDIESNAIARFTKDNKFLKKDYQELK
ncbi:MAG: DUF2326 domain-containing protein [Clostridia bacterium]|nr:DUF2326 domain-containing protein [Clostridia bacterium]